MRVITIIGTKDGPKSSVMALSGTGFSENSSDFLRLMNVLRFREIVECNWKTFDGFNMRTKDGLLFNVKE